MIYKVRVTSPLSCVVNVSPQTLALGSKGQKKSHALTITQEGIRKRQFLWRGCLAVKLQDTEGLRKRLSYGEVV